MSVHDFGPVLAPPKRARPPAPAAREATPPSPLLGLQRAVGNQATSRLLDRDRDTGRDGPTEGAARGAATGAVVGGALGPLGAVAGAALGGLIGAVAAIKTCTINVTLLDGVANTVAADVKRANEIFLPRAFVLVKNTSPTRLSKAESDDILGADGVLDDFTGSTLTAEETKLVTHNRTAGRMTGYYVPGFSHATVRGEAIDTSFGVSDPSVVVGASTRVLDTLAHEIGHILTNEGGHSSDASNLMASGAIRDFTDNLTDTQVSQIRSSPYVS